MITQKSRAERGLKPYVSPKKDWDAAVVTLEPEVLVEKAPSSRKDRRSQATDRKVQARKNSARATRQWLEQRQGEYDTLGVARVYFNTDGAHERSPECARNATRRVHQAATTISQRDEIPWDRAIKVVEGDLLNVLTSAGLR